MKQAFQHITALPDSNTDYQIPEVVDVLEKHFGVPVWRRKDPIDELMVTILSQNTNDRNRDNAYERLRSAIPTWQEVSEASVSSIEEAIRPAGLSKQKSVRMQGVLRWIKESFGSLSLNYLRSLSDDRAIELLTTQKGIGVKTAAVLLAFSLERDLCPVDTHVHRIALRLGWVPIRSTADTVFTTIRPKIPVGKAPTFHLNLLKFGRTICTARSPKCGVCPLWSKCIYPGKTPLTSS